MEKRSAYFTKEILQFRYLGSIIIAVLVPSIFVGCCLYYLIFYILAEQIAIPEAIAVALLPAVKTVNGVIIVGFPILFILLFSWGILVSHRLAGPIGRLEKELNYVITSKDYSHKIILRDTDDLKKVADNINKLLELVRHDKA